MQAGRLRKQSSERRRQAASRRGQEQLHGEVYEECLKRLGADQGCAGHLGRAVSRFNRACTNDRRRSFVIGPIPQGMMNADQSADLRRVGTRDQIWKHE